MSSQGRSEYEPPEALLGETVFWFSGGTVHEPPIPAVVTAVGHDSLHLNVLNPWDTRVQHRDGVRHVDDPRQKAAELREAGAWCSREDYFTRPDVPDDKKAAAGSRAARRADEARAREAAARKPAA